MQDAVAAAARTDVGLQFPGRERAALGAGARPTVVPHTFDVETLLETALMGTTTPGRVWPNVLIHSPAADINRLIARLGARLAQPLTVCPVGAGTLRLPANPGGTLLVHDVAALSVAQQIDLYDWTSVFGGRTQVVAITSEPLAPRVEGGHFLQALFYRLNVLQARVVEG